MRDILEYGEEIPDDDDSLDEEDRIRMEIMAAEAEEVWQEEPGDEDDPEPPLSPLFGMFSAAGGAFPIIPPRGTEADQENHEEKHEDPES